MYKEDLAINNLQWLICHKTNQTNPRVSCEITLKLHLVVKLQFWSSGEFRVTLLLPLLPGPL